MYNFFQRHCNSNTTSYLLLTTIFLSIVYITIGQVHAYWKYIFSVTKEYQHDYGTPPNGAQFDDKWFEKRNKAAYDPTNPFNPFSDTEHYVWAAMENIMRHYATRGYKEPTCIKVKDFEEGERRI